MVKIIRQYNLAKLYCNSSTAIVNAYTNFYSGILIILPEFSTQVSSYSFHNCIEQQDKYINNCERNHHEC